MKIAVVGAGAVGGYYGAKLARAGQSVHFLARSNRDVIRKRGLRILSPEGDFHINAKASGLPSEIGPADLVIVALKTTANRLFENLLPDLVRQDTVVLTLQNGLGNEEQLARFISAEQIMGGLCFVCLNRIEPEVIEHFAHGKIVLGEYQRWPEPRTHDIASMFRNAGIPCAVAENLEYAHWEKLVWNIPFNGLGVASAIGKEAFFKALGTGRNPDIALREPCLTTDRLLADPEWERAVRGLMLETIEIANRLGLKLPRDLMDELIRKTLLMGAYKPSTVLDFEWQRPLELESLFALPLRKGREQSCQAPYLETLCATLQALDLGLVKGREQRAAQGAGLQV